MAAATKIKVPRVRLLERAKAVAAADAKAYEDSQKNADRIAKENDAARAKLTAALLKQLGDRLSEVTKDPSKLSLSWRFNSVRVEIDADIPSEDPLVLAVKEREPAVKDLSEYHAASIRMLEMSVDENLVIAMDDRLARYL